MILRTHATGSSGNLYTVESTNTLLILECGLPLSRIKEKLGANLNRAEAVLITHEHGDHAKAASTLVKRGVKVFATKGTLDALGLSGDALAVCMEPMKPYKIGAVTVIAFTVEHDAAEPVGFILKDGEDKVCFMTDTRGCRYKVNGCTQMYIEANWAEDLMQSSTAPVTLKARVRHSHMSIDQCERFLKACDLSECRKIVLIHMSADRGDAERFRYLIQKATGKPTEVATNGKANKDGH